MLRINIVISCSLIHHIQQETNGNVSMQWELYRRFWLAGLRWLSVLMHTMHHQYDSSVSQQGHTRVQSMMNGTVVYKRRHFTTCISKKQA